MLTGYPLPAGADVSNVVTVQVERRALQPTPTDPDHLVGMQWEPWFTPHNADWTTAQAVPLLGFYRSYDRDVLRQHFLWLAESGVNFLVVDWTNHLWDKKHWDERDDNTNEIIHATTLALETLASLRDEGIPVPKMVLYLGLNNGPSTTTQAINEEMDWIYHNYIRNPRFAGLFQEYLGKPLLLIHNGGGPAWLQAHPGPPIDDRHFTVRWQSSQHDLSHHNEAGYWSWMDGALAQPVTRFEGKPEAMTVSAAFFSADGWRGKGAYGRRGGGTYVESFQGALKYRPRFLELHQFQEFAGQPEGQGYGPRKDIYVDSYSAELSDDIEPTSLCAPAYRGDGGWGFLFLNLTRALVDLYRQKTPETTVVAIARPLRREVITSNTLTVEWAWVGKPPHSFTLTLNGKTVARNLQGRQAVVNVRDVPDGPVTLRLTAEGTKARYLLSYTEDSLPQKRLEPAYAEINFLIARSPD